MSRVPIWHGVCIYCIKPFFWFPWLRHRRNEYLKLLQKNKRFLAGDGAWKTHAVVGRITIFEGICAQPVGSVGWSRDSVDCRTCNRIIKKAGK